MSPRSKRTSCRRTQSSSCGTVKQRSGYPGGDQKSTGNRTWRVVAAVVPRVSFGDEWRFGSVTDENSAMAAALSPVAKALIGKMSIGRLYDPIHARRMNKARNKNRVADAKTDLEVAQIRAEERAVDEQCNVDAIVQKAAMIVSHKAKPEEMDQDWINKAIERMKVVTDDDMRNLWAKIIAGKAESPGDFSHRVLEEVSQLSKQEANAFTELAGYVWCVRFAGEVDPVLVIDKSNHLVIHPNGALMRTALVKFFANGTTSYHDSRDRVLDLHYYGRSVQLRLKTNEGVRFCGRDRFILTHIGKTLFPISGGVPIPGEFEKRIEDWAQRDEVEIVSRRSD